MPILKNFPLPNNAVSGFHIVKRAEYVGGAATLQLTIQSFPDQAAFLTGLTAIWNTSVLMPIDAVGAAFLRSIEIWLIDSPESPLSGGSLAVEGTTELDIAQARQWSKVKSRRDELEHGGFIYDGSTFDSDESSQMRIVGAALAAVVGDVRWLKAVVQILAQRAGISLPAVPDLSIDWTIADNQVRALDGNGIVDVGLALLAHDSTQHAIARELRDAIGSATDVLTVQDINWPVAAEGQTPNPAPNETP